MSQKSKAKKKNGGGVALQNKFYINSWLFCKSRSMIWTLPLVPYVRENPKSRMQMFEILGQVSVCHYSPITVLQLWDIFQDYIKNRLLFLSRLWGTCHCTESLC